MGTLSTAMLLVLLIASGIAVLAMMRVFANIVEHETDLHDLRNRIKHLQFERQLYLARLHGQIGPEDEVIDFSENAPVEAVEAAQQAAAQAEQSIDEAIAQAA